MTVYCKKKKKKQTRKKALTSWVNKLSALSFVHVVPYSLWMHYKFIKVLCWFLFLHRFKRCFNVFQMANAKPSCMNNERGKNELSFKVVSQECNA